MLLSQAKQFCSWIGPQSVIFPGTVFMLDLEEGGGNQSGRANTWFGYVDNFYGLDKLPLNMRSWLYSGDNFARTRGLSPIFNSASHTWVAAYQRSEAGLLPHTLWQSTNGQVGANITNWSGAGKCDTSIAHHSVNELAAMGWKGGVINSTNPPEFHGEYVSAGMLSLHDLAGKLGHYPSTLINWTVQHYGSKWDRSLAMYINDVLAGTIPPTALLPKGTKIWVN